MVSTVHSRANFRCSDGVEYVVYENEAIRQRDPKPFDYSAAYLNKQDHGTNGLQMSKIRMDFVGDVESVCDIGVGSGEFLREAVRRGVAASGYDIAPWEPPLGVRRVERLEDVSADTVTMFDALEHFHDISFLRTLNCRQLVVTVPWCHYHEMGEGWFNAWRHRKPDEHVWHFSLPALLNVMREHGWRTAKKVGHPEDSIRGTIDGMANTLTASFVREPMSWL